MILAYPDPPGKMAINTERKPSTYSFNDP